jgi:hypothetical protein
MSPFTSLTLAGLLLIALAACASTAAPAPDLTPPPPRPYDAKTQLEYGGAPRPPRY